MTTKKEDFDFKEAMKELEEINEWFSTEEIDLEEGLKKLKKGKELIIACQKRLGEVETEFITIKEELEEAEEPDLFGDLDNEDFEY